MENRVFIQTNNKQRLGALVAQHAIQSHLKNPESIDVSIINVDDLPLFKDFAGTKYKFSDSETRTYTKNDLQSFTLSRFMPPEIMGYEGKAIVIDPDIFCLSDIAELFSFEIGDSAIAACLKKETSWDTSVMLLNCSKLRHWKIDTVLSSLRDHSACYIDVISLKNETAPITELSRLWNHLDELTPETKMIHMTGRLTQPWKKGLPIDFTRNRMRKLFGVIPREPIYKLLGKYETRYQQHPNKAIEDLFLELLQNAVHDGAVTESTLVDEINKKNVRPDLLNVLQRRLSSIPS